MSSKGQNAGFNDRYSDARYQGYNGSHGENDAPSIDEDVIAAADPAGTYDGTKTVLIGATNFCVVITVTQVFDGGATIIVGRPGATNELVTLVDAVDLTTLGVKQVSREVAWGATAIPRVTIGGAPTQGAATVAVQWET